MSSTDYGICCLQEGIDFETGVEINPRFLRTGIERHAESYADGKRQRAIAEHGRHVRRVAEVRRVEEYDKRAYREGVASRAERRSSSNWRMRERSCSMTGMARDTSRGCGTENARNNST